MKTITGTLGTHYTTRATTVAHALKITRPDATVFGFTDHDFDVAIGGVTYAAAPGMSISNVVITAGFAVGNMELRTLHDESVFTTPAIRGGVWRNATFEIFRYNWQDPTNGKEPILSGTLGEPEILSDEVVIELRDLRQYLQQPVSSVSSKTCRWRLGSTTRANGGLCKKNLTSFTHTGTLTSAASRQVFTDTSRAEADGYFDGGVITFTGGANSGLSAKIKSYAADTFTLDLPMLMAVAASDTYSAVTGCDRTIETCISKFNNAINFGGEPDRPTVDALSASA